MNYADYLLPRPAGQHQNDLIAEDSVQVAASLRASQVAKR